MREGSDGEPAAAGEQYVLLKYRFHKQYRHPTLDASLTKARVAGEARALMKCLRYAPCCACTAEMLISS